MKAFNKGNRHLKSLFCLIFVQASNYNNYSKTFVGFKELDNVICSKTELTITLYRVAALFFSFPRPALRAKCRVRLFGSLSACYAGYGTTILQCLTLYNIGIELTAKNRGRRSCWLNVGSLQKRSNHPKYEQLKTRSPKTTVTAKQIGTMCIVFW